MAVTEASSSFAAQLHICLHRNRTNTSPFHWRNFNLLLLIPKIWMVNINICCNIDFLCYNRNTNTGNIVPDTIEIVRDSYVCPETTEKSRNWYCNWRMVLSIYAYDGLVYYYIHYIHYKCYIPTNFCAYFECFFIIFFMQNIWSILNHKVIQYPSNFFGLGWDQWAIVFVFDAHKLNVFLRFNTCNFNTVTVIVSVEWGMNVCCQIPYIRTYSREI